MNRKPLAPEPSVFYRRKKGKLKIQLPTMGDRPVALKRDTKGPDRGGGGGKRGRRD